MEQDSTTQDADGTGRFAGEAWFDPIEAGIRARVRGFIEDLLERELTAALGRGRCERAAGEPKGYRNRTRERQFLGSFGPVQVEVPPVSFADITPPVRVALGPLRGPSPPGDCLRQWDRKRWLERALAALWPDVPAQRCTVPKHRNLLGHAPDALHEEVTADYTDMIDAETAKEVQARRRAFLRKGRLRCLERFASQLGREAL